MVNSKCTPLAGLRLEGHHEDISALTATIRVAGL